MTLRPTTLHREQLRPAWRAAVLPYRRARQAGRDHHDADAEAVAAIREALPEMSEKEAKAEVMQAVAYAAA
jgi:hypothetical protein